MTYQEVIFQQKLTYLRRLLKIYVRFLKYYSDVEVEVFGNAKEGGFVPKTIEVKYCKSKNNGYTFQAIEFPVEHLGKRIAHYRAKVKKAYQTRHTNTNWR